MCTVHKGVVGGTLLLLFMWKTEELFNLSSRPCTLKGAPLIAVIDEILCIFMK